MLGLRTVVYTVDNLEKAKKWYTEAFLTEPYFDEVFYVGFNIGGYELGLLPNEKGISQGNEGSIAYWGVKDIRKEYQRILDLGATAHEAPTNVGGELEVASMMDPWGNTIGIIYNPYFKLPTE